MEYQEFVFGHIWHQIIEHIEGQVHDGEDATEVYKGSGVQTGITRKDRCQETAMEQRHEGEVTVQAERGHRYMVHEGDDAAGLGLWYFLGEQDRLHRVEESHTGHCKCSQCLYIWRMFHLLLDDVTYV